MRPWPLTHTSPAGCCHHAHPLRRHAPSRHLLDALQWSLSNRQPASGWGCQVRSDGRTAARPHTPPSLCYCNPKPSHRSNRLPPLPPPHLPTPTTSLFVSSTETSPIDKPPAFNRQLINSTPSIYPSTLTSSTSVAQHEVYRMS